MESPWCQKFPRVGRLCMTWHFLFSLRNWCHIVSTSDLVFSVKNESVTPLSTFTASNKMYIKKEQRVSITLYLFSSQELLFGFGGKSMSIGELTLSSAAYIAMCIWYLIFLNQTSFIPTVLHQLFGCHAVGLSGSLKKKKISVKTIWRASPYCVNIQKQTHSTSIKRVKNAWIVLQGQWFAFIPFQHFA